MTRDIKVKPQVKGRCSKTPKRFDIQIIIKIKFLVLLPTTTLPSTLEVFKLFCKGEYFTVLQDSAGS